MKILKDEFRSADELLDAEEIQIDKQIKSNKRLSDWLLVAFFATLGMVYLAKTYGTIDVITVVSVMSFVIVLVVIISGLGISVLQYTTLKRVHRIEKKLDALKVK